MVDVDECWCSTCKRPQRYDDAVGGGDAIYDEAANQEEPDYDVAATDGPLSPSDARGADELPDYADETDVVGLYGE